ncbi:MAG: hypothetical protein AB1798_07820 [Spirochaetota bacterium]
MDGIKFLKGIVKKMKLNRVLKTYDSVKISNIIISVADKNGLGNFVKGLLQINPSIKIYSTGGTFNAIKEFLGQGWRENLCSVSDYTGQPEMQGGLVKTLDFKIYLGLLSEPFNPAHRKDIKRVNGINFDMVVVNLYPFTLKVMEKDITQEDARAHIDIGGPCLLRAAAKNFLRVTSVSDPADYEGILQEMKKNNGCIGFETRFKCAVTSFTHTAEYDTAISKYLSEQDPELIKKIYSLEVLSKYK